MRCAMCSTRRCEERGNENAGREKISFFLGYQSGQEMPAFCFSQTMNKVKSTGKNLKERKKQDFSWFFRFFRLFPVLLDFYFVNVFMGGLV
jgi:hypothetical protein